jgi:hypothetical protein
VYPTEQELHQYHVEAVMPGGQSTVL